MLALTLVVTGCASTNGTSVAPISHTSGNWWDRYIVYYISQFILWIASLVHDSYGWAIIIFTIIVRIILLPLNAISIRSMAKQQKVQPQMDALRKSIQVRMLSHVKSYKKKLASCIKKLVLIHILDVYQC